MFVKNPNSIKRKTIRADIQLNIYLSECGYPPVSRDGNTWIYILNEDIAESIRDYRSEAKNNAKGKNHFIRRCIDRFLHS